ncbi:protein of unknown function [Chitinophaga costaii]|uniref:DUF4279 domain-containing protein n=2 Tax=Chitinophaga costaii TaxID=1335309 RepID=A0A1C4G7X9_9BACT|nr:protein of unknown function [Chitinophaga costaii]
MAENKKTETKVYLKIHDFDCSIEEITALIGIEPSKAGQKGDLLPKRNIELHRKFSSWVLESGVDIHASVDEHVDALINTITPRIKILKNLIATYNGELTIVVYTHSEYNIGMYIDKVKLGILLDLGVSLDIDIYFLNDTES